MDLIFDLDNMFVSNEMEEFSYLPNMPGSKYKYPSKHIASECGPFDYYYTFKPNDLELFDRVRREFVRRVDQKMQQYYQGEKMIKSLRVDFLLGSDHNINDVIDQWIGCGIANGAERIELLFSHRAYGVPNLDPYRFPHTLFSEIRNHDLHHLQLRNCHLLPHAEFSGFKQLKTLVLEELTVEKDLLLCLFSKCCFHLEDLSFITCQFNHPIDIVSPTLHHLKLIWCDIPSRMDIVTPNLSSLEFGGDSILVFSSINAPKLEKVYLNPYCRWKKLQELEVSRTFDLLASLHDQLYNLSMVLSPSQVAMFPITIGSFQHLIEMELFLHGPQADNDDYLWVLNMVMACPRLQKLYFGIACPDLFANQRERREHPGFSHSELKHVELHGCVGQTIEIEIAIHFLKSVNSLEHITFGPRSRTYLGYGRWFDGFERSHWFETGRNFICEELQDYVSGRTRLIFL